MAAHVRNVAYGMQLGWEDPSRTEAALDGTEYHDERPKTRAIVASLEVLRPDEAHAVYLEMQRRWAPRASCWWCPTTATPRTSSAAGVALPQPERTGCMGFIGSTRARLKSRRPYCLA